MAWTTPATAVANTVLTAAFWNTHVRDNESILKTALNDSGHISLAAETELTIAGGIVTATLNWHRIDTEADASTDDLNTITAGTNVVAGHLLFLQAEDSARTVVVKNGTGNIVCGADLSLGHTNDLIFIFYDGTNWLNVTDDGLGNGV